MTASFDPIWETVFRTQEWGKYPPEHVIRFVARNFYKAPDRRAIRLLDLGAGPGANTWYMAREGFSVAAIDGSATAIERLQGRLGSEGLHAETAIGDFVRLPWPGETFDGVIDNAALYANPFAQELEVVKEVHRVLKHGGLFCSANFTDRTWGYGKGTLVEPGGFRDIAEGPLAGKGFASFLGRARVDELYRPFVDVNVETISYSLEALTRIVELWVVTCRRE